MSGGESPDGRHVRRAVLNGDERLISKPAPPSTKFPILPLLGLTELSMSPGLIADVKAAVRNVDISRAEARAEALLAEGGTSGREA